MKIAYMALLYDPDMLGDNKADPATETKIQKA
jgi:hypothetical protein